MFANALSNMTSFWSEYGDARTSQWLFTSSPLPMLLLITFYLLLVLAILPKVSKPRKELQTVLAVYYFAHSAISLYFLCISIVLLSRAKVDLRCMKLQQTFEGVHYEAAMVSYAWLLFKMSEMLETVLATLAYGRAPVFQYFHHSMHPFMIMIVIHFSPGGTSSLFGIVNNMEHAILYCVIALRIVSQRFKKASNSWFKKFHLIYSIGSLVVSLLIYLSLRNDPECDPAALKILIIACLVIFICCSVGFRWSYISHDDAFGRTKLVLFINSLTPRKRSMTGF